MPTAPSSAAEHLATVIGRLAGSEARPRADQLQAVDAVVRPASRVLVVQATGWGKSAVYWAATSALRAVGRGPTLVVSPLLALMRDQVDAATRAGLRAATVNSTNFDEWDQIFARLDVDDIDVLLVSPERLGNPRFANRLESLLGRVGLIVIDEAHCISDWGFDFRPDYQRLARALLSTPSAGVLATTATANHRVTVDIGRQLGPDTVTFRGTLARTSLRLSVVPDLSPLERYAWIADALAELPGSGIVYVLTVAEAERLAGFLTECGYRVDSYTGQLDADSRLAVERRLRDNAVKAVVATSALGMGYDKPDLGFCVHVGSPSTPVAYYQQVGRAGRALAHAEGVLLPSDADERIWDYFATASIPDPRHVDQVLRFMGDRPCSLVEIETETGVRRGRLEALLKILAVEGIVTKSGTEWVATGERYVHDSAKWDELRRVRSEEADVMRRYARGDGCLMAHLQTSLDDPEPTPCGRCSVCTGRTVFPGSRPTHERLMAARAFLRGNDVEIEPRKRWPSGVSRKGVIISLNAGRAVAFSDDPGWQEELGEMHRTGRVASPLLDGAVATMTRWAKVWESRPVAVVPAPDVDMSANRELAHHIASVGRLPVLDLFRWKGGRAPDDSASATVVSHLESAIRFDTDIDVPAGVVLLVSTVVRSRWNATVSGALLRELGASGVLLLALHQQA